MRISRYFSILIYSFLILSCKPTSGFVNLGDIENIIQVAPDTALVLLRQLPKEEFKRASDLGLYSLLYSMALDKNYIDVCSDSLLRPALSYYSKHGDKYHTFLTYYYLGRIYENARKYDDALKAYLKAEDNVSEATPLEYVDRLYSRKGRVYVDQFANDKALEADRKAMSIASSIDNPAFYLRNCLDVISLLYQEKKYGESELLLDSLKRWVIQKNVPLPSSYYKSLIYLRIYNSDTSAEAIVDLFNSYLTCCAQESIKPDASLSAEVAVKQGLFSNAKDILNTVNMGPDCSRVDSILYYSSLIKVYKGLRNFDKYAESMHEYQRLVETMHLDVFKRDVRFVEERYANERRVATDKRKKSYLILFIVVLTATLIASMLLYKKRHALLVQELNDAMAEYSFLKRIVASADNSKQDIKIALETRIHALSPYFREQRTPRLGRDDIKKLQRDNKEMLRNIGLLYSLSFPGFVYALLQYGLSSEEVGLCSLYTAGFLSKEVSSIIDSGSIYHINSSIRAKLGDVVDARALPSWLRDLFEEYKSS